MQRPGRSSTLSGRIPNADRSDGGPRRVRSVVCAIRRGGQHHRGSFFRPRGPSSGGVLGGSRQRRCSPVTYRCSHSSHPNHEKARGGSTSHASTATKLCAVARERSPPRARGPVEEAPAVGPLLRRSSSPVVTLPYDRSGHRELLPLASRALVIGPCSPASGRGFGPRSMRPSAALAPAMDGALQSGFPSLRGAARGLPMAGPSRPPDRVRRRVPR